MFEFIASQCNFCEYSAETWAKAVQCASCQMFDVCFLLMKGWISERAALL